jgi:hypothetical protein
MIGLRTRIGVARPTTDLLLYRRHEQGYNFGIKWFMFGVIILNEG